MKNISEIGSFPQVGMPIKNIWNHHLVNYARQSKALLFIELGLKSQGEQNHKRFPLFSYHHPVKMMSRGTHNMFTFGKRLNKIMRISIYIYIHIFCSELLPLLIIWNMASVVSILSCSMFCPISASNPRRLSLPVCAFFFVWVKPPWKWHRHGTSAFFLVNAIIKLVYVLFPYHSCMVYLPTVGCF